MSKAPKTVRGKEVVHPGALLEDLLDSSWGASEASWIVVGDSEDPAWAALRSLQTPLPVLETAGTVLEPRTVGPRYKIEVGSGR
eukprot:630894-Pyramimonas_sp.AAC.1